MRATISLVIGTAVIAVLVVGIRRSDLAMARTGIPAASAAPADMATGVFLFDTKNTFKTSVTVGRVGTLDTATGATPIHFYGANRELFYVDKDDKVHVASGVTPEDLARGALRITYDLQHVNDGLHRQIEAAWAAYDSCLDGKSPDEVAKRLGSK